MKRLPFFSNCVNWPEKLVDELREMIDRNITITRRTFLRHVDKATLAEIEKSLGYERRSLTMAKDWAVSYHRSEVFGVRCYYFRWSAIEYVFVDREGRKS
jgi:hypothetical protein